MQEIVVLVAMRIMCRAKNRATALMELIRPRTKVVELEL
jgi:hypothetical protein